MSRIESTSRRTCVAWPFWHFADGICHAGLLPNPPANFAERRAAYHWIDRYLQSDSCFHITSNLGFGPRLGAFMAVGLLVVLCVLSWPAVAILGRGEGALAVVTFLGMSLLIAARQAAPGCELMAIPDLLFGRNAEMPCLIFSPLDWLERKLRRK